MYADLHLKLKEDNSSDLNKYLREFKPSLMLGGFKVEVQKVQHDAA